MKHLPVLLVVMFLMQGLLFPASNFKLKKDVVVPENTTYEYNIISPGGNIDIKGKFKHSVILFGGRLRLDGEIGEDIFCIGSKVEIGKNALVKGDLYVIGGKLTKAAGAQVMGEFTYFRFDLKKIESTLIPILSDVRTITFFRILKIFIWLIIALIVLAIVPRQINSAAEMLETHPVRVGFLGILSLFCLIFLIFIFILLSFILIGIPLLFISILAYSIIYIFGRTIIFYYVGDKITNGLGLRNTAPSLFILIGVILYGLLTFLPVVGPIVLILLNIFELGIGAGFILRKKLRFAGFKER